ncbi:MAG: tRNA threonylcarbamoyladenosine dehydratase [Syntrophomonadaceae bacterium]|nr:tRNA threonylcarbamoyladenosine dehydratase [Syntrophomonadaceae bacterium]
MYDTFFQRTELLVGTEGLEKLKNSWIAIVGLGGVGSYAAEAIARCGVGHITIIDPDRIEPTNLNRQLPALVSTLGQFKVEVISRRMLDINPTLELESLNCAYNAENSHLLLERNLDFVIDAIDALNDKIHLINNCVENGIPIISSMGTANRINPLKLTIADIKDTSICPLARRVRRELRSKYNINQGVPVVYSAEIPVTINAEVGGRLGTMSFVPGTAGLLLASYAINKLLGFEMNI